MANKHNNRYLKKHKANERSAAASKHINLGAIVFLIIFLYIVILLINFAVKESVNYTVAETGILAHSAEYNGLVLRDETVIESSDKGTIKYFYPEGARVRNGDPVFGVVKDPSMVQLLDEQIFKANQNLSSDDPVFDESYNYLKNRIKTYVINQQNKDYRYTYDAKKQIENDIAEIRNTVIIQQGNQGGSNNIHMLESQYAEAIKLVDASKSGLVSYKIDGLESITINNFTTADLTRKPTIQDTSTKTFTETNQPVFKIVDNYLWYIAAEIDDECEKQIEDSSYIGVRFVDKDIEMDVKVYDLYDEGSKTFLILEIDRMISQFLTDRHVNFEITYENHEGIKIPETAIASKKFALIPSQYLTVINKQYVVRKKVISDDALGHETLAPSSIKMFKRQQEMVFVPLSDQLAVGDVLSYTNPDTLVTTEFVIDETEELEGVYVINKGFAVFKFIETNYREPEYRIVRSDVDYGVRIYDRIATEANTTDEYQIIN